MFKSKPQSVATRASFHKAAPLTEKIFNIIPDRSIKTLVMSDRSIRESLGRSGMIGCILQDCVDLQNAWKLINEGKRGE